MKKAFLIAVLVSVAVTVANAQLVFSKTGGEVGFVPKFLTSDNNCVPYMQSSDDKSITILDESFNTGKTFTVNLQKIQTKSFTETAVVEPTGAIFEMPSYGLNGNRYSYYDNTSYTTVYPTAENIVEMISILKDQMEGADFKQMTLGDITACYNANGSEYDFYLYSKFGNKYPGRVYAIGPDNYIFEYYITAYYSPVFDAETAQWKRTNENTYERVTYLKSYDVADLDNGLVNGDYSIDITQNFFNTDNKWEYIVETLSDPYTTYYSMSYYSNPDGSVTVSRNGNTSVSITGLKIVNEDGTVLSDIHLGDDVSSCGIQLNILKGKKYMAVYFSQKENSENTSSGYIQTTNIYLVDDLASSLNLIQSTSSKADFQVAPANGVLEIKLANDFTDSDFILTGVSGQQIGRAHIPAGQQNASLNVSGLPQGVYNATLSRGNKTIGTKKFLIK